MVRVTNLNHAFGAQALFSNVNFTIGKSERVGLVGRNGSGKTTLLNFIAGLAEPDEGAVSCPRGYSVGYMKQESSFSADMVRDEACGSLPKDQRDDTWRAEKVLSGLGFAEEQFTQKPSTLSDGFKARLNLAKALIGGGDLLLLDEPTNYLDIVSIRWLERFLKSLPGELLVITHSV